MAVPDPRPAAGYPPAPPVAPSPAPVAAAPPPGPAYAYAPPAKTADAAIWALVSAIASWLLCPIVLAVVALVLASQADAAIDRSGGVLGGRGLATAARVIAWAHLALVGLLLLFGLAVVIGIAVGSQ